MYKWRDCDLEKFLELYQNQECLWNINIPSYKDKQAREAAYFMIQTFMCNDDITINDVKSKIKTIRSTYSSELNKIVKSLESDDDSGYVYKPKLFWFNQADSFLREVVSTRKSTSKVVLERMQSPTSLRDEEIYVSLESQEVCSPTEPASETIINMNSAPMNVSHNVFNNEYDEHLDLDHKAGCLLVEQTTRTIQGTVNANSKPTKASRKVQMKNEGENEFDLFGRAVGVQLNKMTLPRALACQEAIQRLITNERLRPPFRRRKRLIKKRIVKHENAPTTQIQYILCAPE